jgi:hypothetical protein
MRNGLSIDTSFISLGTRRNSSIVKKNNSATSFALALLSLMAATASALAQPHDVQLSQNSDSLFQLTEVSTPQLIAVGKSEAKCGAGACGTAPKKQKQEAAKPSVSASTSSKKTTKSQSKCGAGACGTRPKK